MEFARREYPRPQFRRDTWQGLNGIWEFCFDDEKCGEQKGYPSGKVALQRQINVPFTYQYPASGIGEKENHEVLWYRRSFTVEHPDKRALLCFNGADYDTTVWVNGQFVAAHRGAYAPFSADITHALTHGENVIVVKCVDPFDPAMPRGKQSWTGEKFGCWYIANSGIWQSVFIDYFEGDCISSYSLVPNIDTCSFGGRVNTLYGLADEVNITVSYGGRVIKKQRVSLDGQRTHYTVGLMELDFVDESFYWTPDRPNLFYVDFALFKEGKCLDVAHTRFGMRKIGVDSQGKIVLNNAPFYQKLILDQGYWEESGITPPSIEAIRRDILLSKEMGFNGARKHQKIEDPYFCYYAEELGFVTWCEMPSAYHFCPEEMEALTAQWQEILKDAVNQTSVITYVPLNESWGVRKILLDEKQQNFARSLYYLTKAVDPSRLVSTNDGWENLDVSDILSIHDYAMDSGKFDGMYRKERVAELYPQPRKLLAENCDYYGTPLMLTEFGGIAMQSDAGNGNWGYNSAAAGDEEFFARFRNLLQGVYANEELQGYCYTQLTDVQQEVNGLLKADHSPKFPVERVRAVIDNR